MENGSQRRKDCLLTLSSAQARNSTTHVIGDTFPPLELYTSPQALSQSVFNSNRLGPCERSPIRTLSEDRVHVSLRLGQLLPDSEEDSADLATLQRRESHASKAAGKRIASSPQGHKRAVRSPIQGVAPKRRRTTTRAHPSPRRKLMLDAIIEGGGGKKARKTSSTAPSINLIPRAGRKEKDFHPLQGSLP